MPDGLADASPEAFAAAEELRSFGDYILSNPDWRGSRGPTEAISAAARTRAGQILTDSAIENTRREQEAPEAEAGSFVKELASLLNKYSKENHSGTPDYILAAFLNNVLEDLDLLMIKRSNWRGESTELPALQEVEASTVKKSFFGKERKF